MSIKKPLYPPVSNGRPTSNSPSIIPPMAQKITLNTSNTQSGEVQKIINQRTLNGKKQFKVIWKGYTFKEATWEPEANLTCKEKINQFYAHYQDVLRRKAEKQAMSNGQQKINTIKPASSQNLGGNLKNSEKQSKTEKNLPLKSSQQSQTPSIVKSISIPPQNKSILKKSALNQRTLDVEDLKNKIIKPQSKSEKKSDTEIVSQKVTIRNTISPKIQTVVRQPDTIEQQVVNTIQETQPNKIESSYILQSERLIINQILGFRQQNIDCGYPNFFLIKNKYSEDEKFVERERILNQCPQKLIEFYEGLVNARQNNA